MNNLKSICAKEQTADIRRWYNESICDLQKQFQQEIKTIEYEINERMKVLIEGGNLLYCSDCEKECSYRTIKNHEGQSLLSYHENKVEIVIGNE